MWVCRVSTQRSRSRSSAAQPALPRLGPCKPAGSEQGRDPSPLYSHVLCRGLPRGSEKARNPHRGRGGTGNPLLTPPHPLPQGRPPWVLGKDVCPRALPGPRGAAAPPFPAPGPTLPQLPALSLPGGRGGVQPGTGHSPGSEHLAVEFQPSTNWRLISEFQLEDACSTMGQPTGRQAGPEDATAGERGEMIQDQGADGRGRCIGCWEG